MRAFISKKAFFTRKCDALFSAGNFCFGLLAVWPCVGVVSLVRASVFNRLVTLIYFFFGTLTVSLTKSLKAILIFSWDAKGNRGFRIFRALVTGEGSVSS